MKADRLLATLMVAAAAATALSACGRRAPLDTPYQAAIEARKQAQEDGNPVPPAPPPPVEDRRFILDGLI